MIMTVTGPISASEPVFCHSHEHLFIEEGPSAQLNPDLRIDDFDRTMEELSLFKRVGGGCIIDAQPVGCGRMAEWLVSASNLSGVNIVASTGFHKLEFYPKGHWIHMLPEAKLCGVFMDEIRLGMFTHSDVYPLTGPIGARAGVIKAAVGAAGLTGRYTALFEAAAECARQTGVPVLCHLEMGQFADEALRFLTERGVPVHSIIFCHLDRRLDDVARIMQAAETGAYLELDTIGRFKYHGDEEEIALILGLIDNGFEDSILLGLDTTRTRMKSYGGSIGLDYIAADFLPRLRMAGVSESTIRKFMFDNPAKAFNIKN